MTDLLLSLITALISMVIGIIGYFGHKYITIIEDNQNTLEKIASTLPHILREINDHSKRIEIQERRIEAQERKCLIESNAKHEHHEKNF